MLTVIGVLLLVLGVGCFGYVGYQLFGTNAASHRSYQSERDRLKQQWQVGDSDGEDSDAVDRTPATTIGGNAIALLSIPAIGVTEVPVLEGTDDEVLARGIGHYTKTADPGQIGNFAVAGHRITHGEPFAKLLDLTTGDRVIVETRSAIYIYRIDTSPRKLTVNDTEGWVLDPVPGKPGTEPTERLITLTTCQDLFHSPDRSVGFGTLLKTTQKSGHR
ncbi:sortase A [Microlunatus soli]|uniref:Sortase A n=1 Tax=Microlunatus soli TaxID=630515 RepID=A0A1H1VMR4_9ACTN|nr:sortase A [Microlunatus soli]